MVQAAGLLTLQSGAAEEHFLGLAPLTVSNLPCHLTDESQHHAQWGTGFVQDPENHPGFVISS